MNKEKIGKILALARHGVDGEKQNAITILKRLCKKHSLDFEDVINQDNEKIQEYSIKYRTRDEEIILGHVISRFANRRITDFILADRHHKALIFQTTHQRYIETLNAYDVFIKLFRKEKRRINEILKLKNKAMMEGFIVKHKLFFQRTKEELAGEKKNQKDIEGNISNNKANRLASFMASQMEDVELQKRIA